MIGEIVSQGREQMELTISGPIYGDNQPMVDEKGMRRNLTAARKTPKESPENRGDTVVKMTPSLQW